MTQPITVVGAGLAGCEAAWALAGRGYPVRLVEMKPEERTPAQRGDGLAELVCSNSLRSSNPLNAVGLLKQEMAALGSLVIRCAGETRVPAGDALAVDRELFSSTVTRAIESQPNIERVVGRVDTLPASGPTVIATGPLTAGGLADQLAAVCGQERLYFYDALAPIVAADSIDRTVAFEASRYGKGESADYLNCPLDLERYERFLDALLAAESMPLHPFEQPRYFQGCLPVEVVAASGRESLRFGTMKPVGLRDPRTGSRPYAVVQLRKEDRAGQAYNLVGFQTKLKHPEQKRVLRLIPGLEQAEFLRLGAIHRNTYLDAPALLDPRMRLKAQPHLRFAGQITGVEGYVESAAHGLLTALLLASELAGDPIEPPPPESALGALCTHLSGSARLAGRPHEPQNVNWGLFPPPPAGTRKKETKQVRLHRAENAFRDWLARSALAVPDRGVRTQSCDLGPPA